MSYERLNLQDFTDIWTAAHVSHVEDGIVNNETRLNIVVSNLDTTKNQVSNNTNKINEHTSQINTLNSEGQDLFESEMINSIMPLWHTLLSNGGEKIYPPTISFDGNVIGKTYLPVDGDGEASIGYVRIGDATASSGGIMTLGGLYHILVQLLPILGNDDKIFNSDINKMTGLGLLYSAVISGEQSYEYGNEPVIVYNSTYLQMLNELNNGGESGLLDFPTAFSIDRSFEFNGMIYPSGFYSIYLFMKDFLIDNVYLPLIYVDKFWALDSMLGRHQANMPLDYSKASNAFECFGESIFWNGIDKLNTDIIIPEDHEFSGFKCISYNPQQFLSACLSATAITWNGNTASLGEMSLFETTYYVLANSIMILPTILCGEGLALPPGVYAINALPFKLQFHGVDTQKLFNKHEINLQYLPEVPEFNLTEMGMSNVPLNGNFVTLEMNTTKLKSYSQKGPVRITIPTEIGEVSCLATFSVIGSTYQSVVTGYYNATKFDTVITFTNDDIQVGIFPISQFA